MPEPAAVYRVINGNVQALEPGSVADARAKGLKIFQNSRLVVQPDPGRGKWKIRVAEGVKLER